METMTYEAEDGEHEVVIAAFGPKLRIVLDHCGGEYLLVEELGPPPKQARPGAASKAAIEALEGEASGVASAYVEDARERGYAPLVKRVAVDPRACGYRLPRARRESRAMAAAA